MKKSHKERANLKPQIEEMLHEKATASLGGVIGGKLVNDLELNLTLRERYEDSP